MKEQAADNIRDVNLVDALGERYLAYALSTIVQRSLPDVRDGLKPVHRRILYAMRLLKMSPQTNYKKCARVVGDVVGKFHPHGEVAIYEALVRLAQDFSVRYPLVEGQGNFGNIDGDGPAAMRYTESRLTDVAEALMENIDANTVNFKQTYDGEHEEPLVMPSAFPNLLANGAIGIAVGMATNIPPHNADELCEGLKAILDNPDLSHAELMRYIQGPDFPTGGVIVETSETISKMYETGRGSIRLRARYEVEKLEFGQYQIVITEIPYHVQKAKLIEKLADLLHDKKLPLLTTFRDESTTDVRFVLEPKNRTVDPTILMESLFRSSDLETRFSLNMNVVDHNSIPRVMSLKQVLEEFLRHRHEVLERRSLHRLDQIARRLEMLDGYLIAFLNLDEVIRIIREDDDPAAVMKQKWNLTDLQVESILNMRLRALRRLEEIEIRADHKKLSDEKAVIEGLLASPAKRTKQLVKEINEIQKAFGKTTIIGKRRTTFAGPPQDIDIPMEAVIEKEPLTIICSKKGWIRAVKGHQVDPEDLKYKEGDEAGFVITAETTDKLLIFATNGRFYTIAADRLPKGRGHGEPIRVFVDLPGDEDIIKPLICTPGAAVKLLVASTEGRGFIVDMAQVVAQTKQGKQILNVSDGAKAKVCLVVSGDHVAIAGDNRKLLVFPLTELPEMVRGRGVQLQKYRDSKMTSLITINYSDGITWRQGSKQRHETDLKPWLGRRAHSGRLAPLGFPRSNRFDQDDSLA